MKFHTVKSYQVDLFHFIRVNKKRFITIFNDKEEWKTNDLFLLEKVDESYKSLNDFLICKVCCIEEITTFTEDKELIEEIIIGFEIIFDPFNQNENIKKK